jgi:hypothetical protein
MKALRLPAARTLTGGAEASAAPSRRRAQRGRRDVGMKLV